MNLKYFLFHEAAHLILVAIICIAFRLDLTNSILVFICSAIIDADHLPFIMRRGLRNWIKIWSAHTPNSYPLHKIPTLIAFSAFSFMLLFRETFAIGIFSISIALHLLWDIIEDVFILRIGIKNWKV